MEYKERDKRTAEKWRKDSGGDGRSVERRGGEGSRVVISFKLKPYYIIA